MEGRGVKGFLSEKKKLLKFTVLIYRADISNLLSSCSYFFVFVVYSEMRVVFISFTCFQHRPPFDQMRGGRFLLAQSCPENLSENAIRIPLSPMWIRLTRDEYPFNLLRTWHISVVFIH